MWPLLRFEVVGGGEVEEGEERRGERLILA